MDIATDKVGEVIILAREIAQDSPSAPAELDGLLAALDEDEGADLLALLWIGRGDFDPEDWDEARETAREEPLGSTLAASAHLADHLEAGLEVMGRSARDAGDDATEA